MKRLALILGVLAFLIAQAPSVGQARKGPESEEKGGGGQGKVEKAQPADESTEAAGEVEAAETEAEEPDEMEAEESEAEGSGPRGKKPRDGTGKGAMKKDGERGMRPEKMEERGTGRKEAAERGAMPGKRPEGMDRAKGAERAKEELLQQIGKEDDKHNERVAKIERIKGLMKESGDAEKEKEAQDLLAKENDRHDKKIGMLERRLANIERRIAGERPGKGGGRMQSPGTEAPETEGGE